MVYNVKWHFSPICFLINLAVNYVKFVFPGNKDLCDNGNLLGKIWEKELNLELKDNLQTR